MDMSGERAVAGCSGCSVIVISYNGGGSTTGAMAGRMMARMPAAGTAAASDATAFCCRSMLKN